MKSLVLFVGGMLLGTACVKLLCNEDAKKAYAQCTAAVLRAKDNIVKVANTVQESAQDILAEARQINAQRAAAEAAADAAAFEDAVFESEEETQSEEAE